MSYDVNRANRPRLDCLVLKQACRKPAAESEAVISAKGGPGGTKPCSGTMGHTDVSGNTPSVR